MNLNVFDAQLVALYSVDIGIEEILWEGMPPSSTASLVELVMRMWIYSNSASFTDRE